MALAGLPLTAAWRASAASGVRLGVATYSFRDLLRNPGHDNVDDGDQGAAVCRRARDRALVGEHGAGRAEQRPPRFRQSLRHIRRPLSRPHRKRWLRRNWPVRNALRRWRLATPAANHEAFRARFQSAGIGLFAYRVDYDDQFTDEEIDVTFQQAKALGSGHDGMG